MELRSQKLRELAPEIDPLRLGTGWKLEDLSKPQIIIESTFGDSHPGSGHLLTLVEEAKRVLPKPVVLVQDTSVQIFVTVNHRVTTV